MALSIATSSGGAEFPKGVPGNLQYRIVEVTFDSSYATGGESFTADDIGLDKIEFVVIGNVEDASGTDVAFFALYDYSNSKIKVYNGDASNTSTDLSSTIEVANAGDLSNVTARIMVYGR
tara:strand:+ start:347 stop:706 length:360 start_codon:yes stop_codon:yes gene_type:complete